MNKKPHAPNMEANKGNKLVKNWGSWHYSF